LQQMLCLLLRTQHNRVLALILVARLDSLHFANSSESSIRKYPVYGHPTGKEPSRPKQVCQISWSTSAGETLCGLLKSDTSASLDACTRRTSEFRFCIDGDQMQPVILSCTRKRVKLVYAMWLQHTRMKMNWLRTQAQQLVKDLLALQRKVSPPDRGLAHLVKACF
jgi:hypothetical protein